MLMSSSSTHLPTPEGPGSVSGAPNLSAGFTDTFTSHYVDTAELRQHVVIGGEGPPLLLVHGWPENWSRTATERPRRTKLTKEGRIPEATCTTSSPTRGGLAVDPAPPRKGVQHEHRRRDP
jgi:hypothetical protein